MSSWGADLPIRTCGRSRPTLREIRGEFGIPIQTNVPGIEIGECFPRIASIMDKCVVIRSVTGSTDAHDAMCQTGWNRNSITSVGGRPSIGSVVAKLQGPVDRAVPPSVALAERTQHVPWSEPGSTGFLGAASQPFKPQGQGMDSLRLNGVSVERLQDRRQLLQGLDQLKREVDATGMLRGMDAFSDAAFGVLTSSKLVDALDLLEGNPAGEPAKSMATANRTNISMTRRRPATISC